jgi:hypothetical protein
MNLHMIYVFRAQILMISNLKNVSAFRKMGRYQVPNIVKYTDIFLKLVFEVVGVGMG